MDRIWLQGMPCAILWHARKAVEDMSKEDEEYERLLQHFLTGPETFCDKRFKLIPSVEEGPWLVKKGVGNTPAILA